MGQGLRRNAAARKSNDSDYIPDDWESELESVNGVTHLPGGQRIITCSTDGSLRVWSSKDGQLMGSWQDGECGVYTIALSPDGKKVVSGCGDGAVKLWDIGGCNLKVVAKWTGHAGRVSSVCWNRDGSRVVSGSEDGTARVWEGGKTILGPIKTGLTTVKAVIYLADTDIIATGGYNKTKKFIKIWDANTGKLITNLIGHTSTAYCLTQTTDGKTLISGSYDGSVRTWNTATWKQIAVFTEYTGGSVFGVAVSPNGRILASALSDETVRLWNLENGQPISSPLQHPSSVACTSFSTDGKLLATGCTWARAPYTWDVSAILREAGLDDLLLDSNTQAGTSQNATSMSVLDADTLHPVQPPNNTRNTLPEGFFAGHIHPPPTGPPKRPFATRPPSAPRSALVDQLSSLFRRPFSYIRDYTAHDMPSRRTIFSRYQLRRDQPDTELGAAPVGVPYTRGRARNMNTRTLGEPRNKHPVSGSPNIMPIYVSTPSQSTNSSVAMQQSGAAQVQQSPSQLHPLTMMPAASTVASAAQQSGGAVYTQQPLQAENLLTTTSAAAAPAGPIFTMSITGPPFHPGFVIRQPGLWTRFWLFLGCVSVEIADSHH